MAKGGATTEFLAEAQEIVDALNRDLIAADQEARAGDVDPDRVNGLFRNAHSLKGISSMFSLLPVSHLAHELESVLDSMRLGKVGVSADALDVLFACVEQFGTLIDAAGRGAEIDEQSIEQLLARLRAVAAGGGEKPSELMELVDLGEDVLSVLTEYEEHRLRENVKRGRKLFILRSAFDLSNFDVGLAEIDAAVKKVGEVITKLPSSKPTDPNVISFDILVGSDTTAAELARALGDERVEVVPIGRRAMVAQPAERPLPEHAGDDPAEPETAGVRSVSRTVRVDIRRLDRLMNLVGELGLTKLAFQRLSDTFRRQQGFTELAA
ncbi:MAG: Hpt domain-containing protein, partial [Deltaproteobacteria bacterium]|nr:Hpt domain-containing protein [Deltaproteobacteria bacterium]